MSRCNAACGLLLVLMMLLQCAVVDCRGRRTLTRPPNATGTLTFPMTPSRTFSRLISVSLSIPGTLSGSRSRSVEVTETASDNVTVSRPSRSLSRSGATYSGTVTIKPPPTAMPLANRVVVTSTLASSFIVAAGAALAVGAPFHVATDIQLLVAWSMSPCANESVRLTFAWAEPLLLGFPVSWDDNDIFQHRGADLTSWGVGALTMTAICWSIMFIGGVALPSPRLARLTGISIWMSSTVLLPTCAFLGGRLALFPPRQQFYPALQTRSVTGTAVGTLLLVVPFVGLRLTLFALRQVRCGPHCVLYKHSFHGGAGRCGFPASFWADTLVFDRYVNVVNSAPPGRFALVDVVLDWLRTVLAAFLFSVDVDAMGFQLDRHCRVALAPAAALIVAVPCIQFVLYRGPSRHPSSGVASVVVSMASGACAALQCSYWWLSLFGSPFIVGACVLFTWASVCVALSWIYEALIWKPRERRAAVRVASDREAEVARSFPDAAHDGDWHALLHLADHVSSHRLVSSPQRIESQLVIENDKSPRNPFLRLL